MMTKYTPSSACFILCIFVSVIRSFIFSVVVTRIEADLVDSIACHGSKEIHYRQYGVDEIGIKMIKKRGTTPSIDAVQCTGDE